MYILSQVLVGIGMIIDLVGKIINKKKYFLLFLLLACSFYTASYVCLLQPLPVILNLIGVIRSIWFAVLEKKEKEGKDYITPVMIFVIITFVSYAIFFTNWLDIVLPISMIVASVALVFRKMLYVRIGLIINSVLWLVFNLSIKGYINALCDISTMILLTTSIVLYDVLKIQNQKTRSKDRKKLMNEDQNSVLSTTSSTNSSTKTKED